MYTNLYYLLKPFISRRIQILLRRVWIWQKRKKYANVWPIDERAARRPEGWAGWPEDKRFAIVITHDVETSLGVEKCIPLAEIEKGFGFRSSFNFVVEDYPTPSKLFEFLRNNGFEIGLHGLSHNENMFKSKKAFLKKSIRINCYLKDWGCVGFRAPSMYHNLDWMYELNIEYDSSTFDTDPFEPQSDGVGTIFPFWVQKNSSSKGYVELPYTLPQDFTLFVLMKEKSIDIWKRKLDWIVENGGMALLNTHPDYMNFDGKKLGIEEYPAIYYEEFLEYIRSRYKDRYWNVLPKEIARFWVDEIKGKDY